MEDLGGKGQVHILTVMKEPSELHISAELRLGVSSSTRMNLEYHPGCESRLSSSTRWSLLNAMCAVDSSEQDMRGLCAGDAQGWCICFVAADADGVGRISFAMCALQDINVVNWQLVKCGCWLQKMQMSQSLTQQTYHFEMTEVEHPCALLLNASTGAIVSRKQACGCCCAKESPYQLTEGRQQCRCEMCSDASRCQRTAAVNTQLCNECRGELHAIESEHGESAKRPRQGYLRSSDRDENQWLPRYRERR